jgi:PadR family transcriptional regulator PadR
VPRGLGNTTVRVLHAVSRGVRYGFDIMDATGLPAGTVYPALSRLEGMGHLTSDWQDPREARQHKRPPRKYYAITDRGRVALSEAAASIRALDAALANKSLRRGEARS